VGLVDSLAGLAAVVIGRAVSRLLAQLFGKLAGTFLPPVVPSLATSAAAWTLRSGRLAPAEHFDHDRDFVRRDAFEHLRPQLGHAARMRIPVAGLLALRETPGPSWFTLVFGSCASLQVF
jgi:hypothetical protein